MKRRPFVQSCIAALATMALVTAAGLVGPLSFFFNLFVPLPVALLTLLQGGGYGVGCLLGVTTLVALFGGDSGWLMYLTQSGLPALLIAVLLRRGQAWDKSLFVSLLVTVGGALAILLAATGGEVGTLAEGFTSAEIDRAVALYQGADLTQEQRAELTAFATTMKTFVAASWPGLGIILLGMLQLSLVYLLSLLPLTQQLVPGPPFALWKAPELLVWPLILGGFGLFVEGAVRTIGLNLLLVLVPIYFLQGLAIVTYFFQQRGLPPLLRSIGYLMLVLLNPLPLIVAALGLFDLWVDFRKPRSTNT